MRKTTLVAGFALVALLSTPAFAQRSGPPGPVELNLGTTLATPPLSGFFFICQVVNVGSTAVLVGVKIFDNSGTQISISGDGSDPAACTAVQQLQPRHACRVGSNDFVFRFSSYCEITVVGNAEAVRGSLADDNGNAIAAR
jgi:hypothetical protein